MSDELTQLRALEALRPIIMDETGFDPDECDRMSIRVLAALGEADTKPLVDPADVEAIAAALTIANRKTDAFDAAWAAVSRIRQALQPQGEG